MSWCNILPQTASGKILLQNSANIFVNWRCEDLICKCRVVLAGVIEDATRSVVILAELVAFPAHRHDYSLVLL